MRTLMNISVIALSTFALGIGAAQAQAPGNRGAAKITVGSQQQSKKNNNNSSAIMRPGTVVRPSQENHPTGNNNRNNDNNRNNNSNRGNGNHNGKPITRPATEYHRPGFRQPILENRGDHGITRPNYQAGRPIAPPMRDYRPREMGAPRPVTRPSNYHSRPNVAYINSVLGLAFNTGISYGLTTLYDNNYYIDGYSDDVIYLRDVRELGYDWEDVMMNYSYGRLSSAQFVYSTRYDNESRYNSVYYDLCRLYGDPVMLNYNTRSPQGSMAWFGYGSNNYVTLDYYRDYAWNGSVRYYTVLTYCTGN